MKFNFILIIIININLKMNIKINDHNLKLEKEYIGYQFASNIISQKYKLAHLEVNFDTIITIDEKKYKFSEFKNINRKTIDHCVSNITQKSYKFNNIIISTRINYDNIEEITFIIVEDPNIFNSLSEPINHIIDNIYIGNLLSVIDDSYLNDYSIKNIVRVFDGELDKKEDINYLVIDIDDNLLVDITKYFDNFINFVKSSQGNILIHCQHGSSRSGSFVILYLMYFHKMKYDDALNFARTKRYGICPNNNFKNQLTLYFSQQISI